MNTEDNEALDMRAKSNSEVDAFSFTQPEEKKSEDKLALGQMKSKKELLMEAMEAND